MHRDKPTSGLALAGVERRKIMPGDRWVSGAGFLGLAPTVAAQPSDGCREVTRGDWDHVGCCQLGRAPCPVAPGLPQV